MVEETAQVEEKALTIVDQAKAVKVVDSETYLAAGNFWKQLGDMIKEVKDTFDPICEASHRAHRAATAKRAKYLDPLTDAQRRVKQLMSTYDAEQDRIRREEERRLAEIARKEEEERRIQEAIAAEEEARRNGATKEQAEVEAEQVLSEPVYVAPVVLPKATPKMQGGPVYRTVWKFKIENAAKIPREYLIPDMVKIGAIGRDMKGVIRIPGIIFYQERC